ncbi:spermatogenesis-associated protein 20-like [Phalaenopsis equestris]|uniref:spermatogenesis-associated protein 20-like n=1 Tax=Phalaenopsis equestris TaxID=78828 RepID=UPI0009E4D5CD|nr:spermatogenesis-associated protein 20-like [Phalaenopsis equestris]
MALLSHHLSFAGFSALPRRHPFPYTSTARRRILRCIRVFSMEESSKTGPRYTNRLATEHSPYLLQHAHNPVDWYPWGDEAFEKARKRAVPIFLSIGYSTCHWCHVMEVESFENDEIARMLNEWFVSIKVDREERPDVDKVS